MSTLLSLRSKSDPRSAPNAATSLPWSRRLRRPDRAAILLASLLVASMLLYAAGVTFAVVIVCIAVGACLLPPVSVMGSLVGRLFLSTVVFVAAFQVAAVIQYLVLPSSDFLAAASITTAMYLVAVLLNEVTAAGIRHRIQGCGNRHDAAGLIVAAIFLLPFIPIIIGDNTVARVAQIGGSQAIDATNHFSMIARLMEQQNLGYSATSPYYPSGFHIATAFVQDSLNISQTSMSWTHGVFLFMGQYLVLGVLLSGAIGYLLSAGLTAFGGRRSDDRPGGLLVAASIATGAVVSPFLLWSFVQQGFLSYFYVLLTILVAFTVLLTGTHGRLFSSASLYLLLIFGAGMSWPLLIPPLLATLALAVCRKDYLRTLRRMSRGRLIGVALLLGMQLIPLAFQFTFTASGGGQGINSLGGLRTFHPLSLLVSAVIIMALAGSRATDVDVKGTVIALLLPILTFVGVLALMQFFLLGEVRYYVIKTAFVLETLNLVLVPCLVALALSRLNLEAVGKFLISAVLPVVIVFSLAAVAGNPLTDVRNLFRTEARAEKPQFFDADLALYSELGEAGRVDGFNTTVLHYDTDKKTYFAHMQIEYWANMMRYDATRDEYEAAACSSEAYKNLAFGHFTSEEQHSLIVGLKECARIAKTRGKEFIIVTDRGSADAIRGEFGDFVTVDAG